MAVSPMATRACQLSAQHVRPRLRPPGRRVACEAEVEAEVEPPQVVQEDQRGRARGVACEHVFGLQLQPGLPVGGCGCKHPWSAGGSPSSPPAEPWSRALKGTQPEVIGAV